MSIADQIMAWSPVVKAAQEVVDSAEEMALDDHGCFYAVDVAALERLNIACRELRAWEAGC